MGDFFELGVVLVLLTVKAELLLTVNELHLVTGIVSVDSVVKNFNVFGDFYISSFFFSNLRLLSSSFYLLNLSAD